MIKQDAYGESTIAMSVYNLIGMVGRPVDFSELHMLLNVDFGYNELTEDLLKRSIDGLLDRKWVLKRGEFYSFIDSKRRRVVSRNRNDAHTNHETGVIEGGWTGWVVLDQRRGHVSIEEVMG